MKTKMGIQESGVRSQEKKRKSPGSWILAPEFPTTLLTWYHKHKRDLPWRRTKDPYKIWISEIMLQQTTVTAVIDYYHRFLKRFPDVRSLAEAPEDEVLALWSGLGYYSRAKNLHLAARQIMERHSGRFPRDPEAILSLPGIGRYTLGAIASIAFDHPLPLVDGNVIRVYARLFARKGSVKDRKFQKWIWKIAEQTISSPSPQPSPSRERGNGSPGDFNQALMELGATICTPQDPKCLICPVSELCKGRLLEPERFPGKKERPLTVRLKRVAAVIKKDGKVLLTLSTKHRWMKGLWQLPSRFSKDGESPEDLLKKLLKEMGLRYKNFSPFQVKTHAITHHKITIHPYAVEAPRGRIKKVAGIRQEWIPVDRLANFALPSADRSILFLENEC